jgi:hypothetical protein
MPLASGLRRYPVERTGFRFASSNVPWEHLSGPAALTFRLIEPPSQEFEAVTSTKVLPPFSIISAALRPKL